MRTWKAGLIAALSVALAVYSAALLYEGFLSGRYSGLVTFPFVDEAAAERAYDRLPTDAPIASRQIAAQRLIQADPANPESWNAIAYTDWLAHGRTLGPVGVQALGRSYAIGFFDRQQAVWRVAFAVENWASLTPDLRQKVMTEARLALHDGTLGPPLRERLQRTQSDAGQVAAAALLAMNAA